MNDFLVDHLNGIITFIIVLLLIGLSNLAFIYNPRRYCELKETPFVSILVPARNEEKSIAACVQPLLEQDYLDYEVIILDDNSEDRTAELLNSFEDPRLRWIKGKPLPHGWAGKNWACHQLYQIAKGDYFIFTDADTVHKPEALSCVVAAVQHAKAGFASFMPRQLVDTAAEKLIVPVINWAIFFYLPLILAYKLPFPFLSAAVGQFIIFSRSAYEKSGGHAAVKVKINEDLALARQVKSVGVKWALFNGRDLLSCRMYSDAKQVWHGFGKNLFSLTGYRILPHLFIWLWTALVFIVPALLLLVNFLPVATISTEVIMRAAVAYILSSFLWLVMVRKFGLSLSLAVLFPLAVFMTTSAAIYSMVLHLRGRTAWKNRSMEKVKFRWL